ncbi:hypothetical protein DSM106972_015930 [Dulcicalothrix desertica PCC 7102]|uniref:Uncharacterized protein n=1 Tax=Dulcicalothrix desertica PCC 7102 TaxID=232991 RepID=A0A3S1AQ70_9CYAN|nr:hypothetical protein [Dulcicalothrix desertica]RUT08425.1 hypothetical protein DSM106972_015930 [Dulcicalothrix desertica PCC 7102]TWH40290.1 hypothetical protein CAL7102_09597 [Dulcicalothrix desertica PCC 7102]
MQPRPYDAVLGGRVKSVEQIVKSTPPKLDKFLTKQGKYLRVSKKSILASKKVTEAMQNGRWSQVGSKFGAFMKLAGIAINIFGVLMGVGNLLLSSQINESAIRNFEILSKSLTRSLQATLVVNSRVTALNKQFEKLKRDLDATKVTLYGDVQNLLRNLPRVRKTANDALFEVRAGRAKLEALIAAAAKKGNDALFEVRAGRAKLEAQIAAAAKKGNDALFEVRAGRAKLEVSLNQQNTRVNSLNTRVQTVENKLRLIPTTPNNNPNTNDLVRKFDFPNLIRQNAQTINNITEPFTAKYVDGKLESVRKGFDGKLSQKLDKDKLITEIQQKSGDIIRIITPAITNAISPVATSVKGLELTVPNLAQAIGNLSQKFGGFRTDLDNNTRRIDRESIDNDRQAIDIEVLKQKVREQEKVNAEGNKKLDDLLKWSLGIPPILALIPRKTADLVNPNIPSKNDIKNIVRDNTPQSSCRFTEVPIYDAANGVKTQVSALDAAQTALITANTAISNTINDKIGTAIPNGGLGGAIGRIFENKIIDRAIAYITMVTSLHNALMLSNNLAQTLFSAGDTILQAFGVKIKDAKGDEIGIGNVINGMFESTFKLIFGDDNYSGMRKAWLTYSRIYQSASNLLNNVQSMFDTARSIAEMTVANVGKIGNALKKAGAVYENAYNWMSEKASAATARQQSFEKFRQGLESAENIASSVESVASDVVSIQSELNEFKQNKDNFISAVNGETEKKEQDEQKEKPNLTLTFDGSNLSRSDSDE